MEQIERALTFAKQKYYDSGPRAQKLLAWRLRRQKNKASILKIKDRYYQKLYTLETQESQMEKIQKYLQYTTVPEVTEDRNNHLIKSIMETELYDIIKKTKSDKCPGSDGFTNE